VQQSGTLPQNALLKIAIFYGFLGVVGGISAPFAGNPNRQPEI
jgi:hypothetical protein